jgi:acyl-CoA thioester hydrolase
MNTLLNTEFKTKIEVRYCETDAMGIVHHSSYVNWFELSRIRWLADVGLAYHELEKKGTQIPVIGIQVKYLKSIAFGDDVDISLKINYLGKARFKYVYNIFKGEILCATGESEHAVVHNGRPIRIPEWFFEKFPEEAKKV